MRVLFRKALVLFLLLAVATVSLPAHAQKPGTPLSEREVLDLVKNFVPSERIVELVEQFGISFEPTGGYLAKLRTAGADDALIKALRNAKPRKPAESAKPAEPVKQPEPARENPPLSQSQVSKLVGDGIPDDAVAELVTKLGISFEPDREALDSLRNAGAKQSLLTALSKAKRFPPPPAPQKSVEKAAAPAAKPESKTPPQTEEAKQPPAAVEPAPKPPQPTEPLNVGGEVSPPTPIYTPGAPYTEQARRAHLQGMVVLAIVIDEQGQVTKMQEISKPLGMGLDGSAFQTVGTWKFKAALFRGMPVTVRVNVQVNFHLQN